MQTLLSITRVSEVPGLCFDINEGLIYAEILCQIFASTYTTPQLLLILTLQIGQGQDQIMDMDMIQP